MQQDQRASPLYDALKQFARQRPLSFHVPGHKNGRIFARDAWPDFETMLSLDLTELTGLDDLHAPEGIIREAQALAGDFFGADHTHFLIGGSTAGNLAKIMAVCSPGDKVIVQRNSHKSIFNALELSGARPVLIAPAFDRTVGRQTNPTVSVVQSALQKHPDAKAVLLTYPDYFGKTYALGDIIAKAHQYDIPVLVDEAHGVHFSLHDRLPDSAVLLGADAVVQSAHKMAPAMTMGAFLHVQSARLSDESIRHYLQMVESSSPSYPILASLDLARAFLAKLTANDWEDILNSSHQVAQIFKKSDHWSIVPSDDPLKTTLQPKRGITGKNVAQLFEKEGIYPEMATHQQVLFIHGLAPFTAFKQLEKAVKHIDSQLKNTANHDILESINPMIERVTELAIDYSTMKQYETLTVPLLQSPGYVAAEIITPYPPGIPFILKGERIHFKHIQLLKQLLQQGAFLEKQTGDTEISVFK